MIIRTLSESYLVEMSNVRGNHVINPGKLPFSFYFSGGNGNPHDIRVKPMFNPAKLRKDLAGTLRLCDDWKFERGAADKHVSASDIKEMKEFFRRHLVLFCMVWDYQLTDPELEDYFVGDITLNELLKGFDQYENYKDELDKISTVEELEAFCRNEDLVNFRDNLPI